MSVMASTTITDAEFNWEASERLIDLATAYGHAAFIQGLEQDFGDERPTEAFMAFLAELRAALPVR